MKDQGNINAHDTLVDNLLDTQIERLDEQPEDKKPQGQSKCSRFLKYVSFGQYRTPLYYRQNETYSSKTGGIITLISATLFVGYSIYLLNIAFQGYEKVLNSETRNFQYLNYAISDEVQCVEKDIKNCAELSIEQFIKAYFDQDPIYCITVNDTQMNECNQFQLYINVENGHGSVFSIISDVEFSPDRDFLQCCSTSLDATSITIQFQDVGLDVQESALYQKKQNVTLRGEQQARFYILFDGLDKSNTIVIKMRSSKSFSERGSSEIEVQAPFIPYSSYTTQKLSFISYSEYSKGIFENIFSPDLSLETFQYISQSSQIYRQDDYFEKPIQVDFYVQAEQITYVLYPSGLVNALTKIGGLLAILKISIIINFLHKRCFEKKINEEIASNQIAPDEEEGKKPVIAQNLYSIENFNLLLQRVKQLEGDMKRVLQDKKDD